jgi:hypothetical protein
VFLPGTRSPRTLARPSTTIHPVALSCEWVRWDWPNGSEQEHDLGRAGGTRSRRRSRRFQAARMDWPSRRLTDLQTHPLCGEPTYQSIRTPDKRTLRSTDAIARCPRRSIAAKHPAVEAALNCSHSSVLGSSGASRGAHRALPWDPAAGGAGGRASSRKPLVRPGCPRHLGPSLPPPQRAFTRQRHLTSYKVQSHPVRTAHVRIAAARVHRPVGTCASLSVLVSQGLNVDGEVFGHLAAGVGRGQDVRGWARRVVDHAALGAGLSGRSGSCPRCGSR